MTLNRRAGRLPLTVLSTLLFACGGSSAGDQGGPGAPPDGSAPGAGDTGGSAPAPDVAEDAEAPAPGGDTSPDAASGPEDVALPDAEIPTDTAQGPGDGDVTTGPCPAGTACDSGWCVAPRVTDQCVTDADCPGAGTFCNAEAVGGICLGCGADEDCPDGFTCTDFGACAIACDVDDDCPTGRCYAAQGLCGQRDCTADADCPSGTVCLEGGQCGRVTCPDPCAPNPCDAPNRSVCTAGESGGHTCGCDPGFVPAGDGSCERPAAGACPVGFSCVAGRCADAEADGFQCAEDEDCGAGRTCSAALPSGVCTGCASAADCPAGHDRCLAGRCLRSCVSSADCHAGMRCNNGVCGQLPCRVEADCGPDHDCDLTAAEPRCVRRACE